MMSDEKEVYFSEYCGSCEYVLKLDSEGLLNEKCEDCLATPMNTDSHKPVNYKEVEK